MSNVASAFLGAFILAVVAGALWIAYRLWGVLSQVLSAIKSLPELVGVLKTIASEMGYMRQFTAPPDPAGVTEFASEVRSASERKSTTPVPYPTPLLHHFPTVPEPDATVDDTDRDMLTQTDAELANIEIVESLRDRGIQVEDDDTKHEGVQASV